MQKLDRRNFRISTVLRKLTRCFYRSNNDPRKQSSKVNSIDYGKLPFFELSTAVGILGPFTFLLGLARDYLAFGWCRAICFVVLIFSYFMLALAEPGKTDWMLYFWILQFGSGTTLMLSYFHIAKLFPLHQALLIGFFNVGSDLSSMIPQLWIEFKNF